MALSCPACQQTLRVTRYEGEKVALCTGCRGCFLAGRSLRQIERNRDIEVPLEAAASPTAEMPELSRACPRCKLTMRKARYGELGGAIVDQCQQCGGIWLDPGELEAIQLNYEAVNPLPTEDSPPAYDFACPKCGFSQQEGEQCQSCGVYFAKIKQQLEQQAARDSVEAETTARVEAVLKDLFAIAISQQYHITEALFSFERANEYFLQLHPAQSGRWHIQELNANGYSILGRQLFGLLYTFTMELRDQRQQLIMTMKRRPRLYFHELDILDENGNHAGRARLRFSWLSRIVSVEDNEGTELLRLTGPVWKPWTFQIYQGLRQMGTITKKWSGSLLESFTDADNFSIRFDGNLNTRRKRLVIGGLMLVDSLYFEGKKPFWQHFISTPGIQLVLASAAAVLSLTALLSS